MIVANLKNCFVTNIVKLHNTIHVTLHTQIFDINFDFKYLRKTSPVGTVYIYIGNYQKPFIEKFLLHGFEGKFPKVDDIVSWSQIVLNILRFRICKILYNYFDESVLNSLYYKICDTEKPERKKPEKLWK